MTAGLLMLACLSLHGAPAPKWTTGFWYWHRDSSRPAAARNAAEVLYLHVGGIRRNQNRWFVDSSLPEILPPAREYWLVFRAEQQGVPDLAAAPRIAAEFFRVLGDARERRLKIAGVQLDVDSPTNELSRYAEFLRAVRRDLPAGMELSITALLDWFRDGTSIADVVRATDEFVPQFYDAAPLGTFESWAIAAKVDPVKWAPRFNRFGKPYRIGIPTFGRARSVGAIRLYSDLVLMDFAANPAFEVLASHNEAFELELRYRAMRNTRVGYGDFKPGDAVEFTMATPESVRSGVENAHRMGGYCAGVIFFRWPATNEAMVMQPDEVLDPQQLRPVRVDAVDGQCAAVSCVDLYLMDARRLAPRVVRYRVRSSVALDYFLPQERMPVRMAGPSEVLVTVPAYGGQSRMLLGRAVSKDRGAFSVEEVR